VKFSIHSPYAGMFSWHFAETVTSSHTGMCRFVVRNCVGRVIG
jgi:hypothetical protein